MIECQFQHTLSFLNSFSCFVTKLHINMPFVNGISHICQLTLPLKQIIVFTQQQSMLKLNGTMQCPHFSKLCPNIMQPWHDFKAGLHAQCENFLNSLCTSYTHTCAKILVLELPSDNQWACKQFATFPSSLGFDCKMLETHHSWLCQ